MKLKFTEKIQAERKKIILIGVILLSFIAGFTFNYFYQKEKTPTYLESNYIQFINDVYSTIKNNYWEKISDKELTALFQKGAEKITGRNILTEIDNLPELDSEIYKIINQKKNEDKEKFVSQLANIVLVNLKPFGRSSLYNQKKQIELAEKVENINQKTGKKEPTVKQKIIAFQPTEKENQFSLPADVTYIKIGRISPSTFQEFKKTAEKLHQKNDKVSNLIIDLRNNIGGSFDLLPYFLGPFIGKDQYAFDLYHQGEKIPFRTKTGWLPSLFQYKKVVVLINRKTQSSAEIIAAVLKRYNVGVLVGEKTKGWGTIERVFPIKHQISQKNKYSIFLVHSLTLRDDNQPIEGNGVEPTINIKNKNWQKKLYSYFNSESLIKAVESLYSKK